jgi:hypothetical protein
MLWLGRWQLQRAEAGNELSWAYTFEWPLFAVLGVAFWIRTAMEELRSPAQPATSADAGPAAPPGAESAGNHESAGNSESAAAYAARLAAEVRRHGRWHGLR